MVFNCRINPNYFLDEMTIKEVTILLNNFNLNYQNSWNQIRFIGFINANVAGAKLELPTDLITFPWEETEENKIIKKDVNLTKQNMLEILNKLK